MDIIFLPFTDILSFTQVVVVFSQIRKVVRCIHQIIREFGVLDFLKIFLLMPELNKKFLGNYIRIICNAIIQFKCHVVHRSFC